VLGFPISRSHFETRIRNARSAQTSLNWELEPQRLPHCYHAGVV
jgi:hypothetical protein